MPATRASSTTPAGRNTFFTTPLKRNVISETDNAHAIARRTLNHSVAPSAFPKKTMVATIAPGPANKGVPSGTMATDVRCSGDATS